MMTTEGMVRLNEFLDARDDLTEARRRKMIAAFLDTHAAALEEPGPA